MRKGYDFSKGVRGKFYRPGLKLEIPLYLDDEAMVFVQRIARKKKTDVSAVVNDLILSHKRLAEVIE
ncbi:MAG: hypothetical protein FJ290_30035 [Planctomycetes bacterium]|nr:hypothetical protein [Planctomycetota bacterium]